MWPYETDPATKHALEAIGAEVRGARLARGWSQRRLAGLSGVSQSTISRLECGVPCGMRLNTLARVHAALGAGSGVGWPAGITR